MRNGALLFSFTHFFTSGCCVPQMAMVSNFRGRPQWRPRLSPNDFELADGRDTTYTGETAHQLEPNVEASSCGTDHGGLRVVPTRSPRNQQQQIFQETPDFFSASSLLPPDMLHDSRFAASFTGPSPFARQPSISPPHGEVGGEPRPREGDACLGASKRRRTS